MAWIVKNGVRWLFSAFVGLSLALTLFLFYSYYKDSQYLNSPIENIFSSEVLVPDFKFGEDPRVNYIRTIKETFVGDFSVEVKDISTGITVCRGGGSNILYEKDEPFNNDKTLNWYVNDDCTLTLAEGSYFLVTNYVLRLEGYPDRFYKQTSNVFKVTA